MELRKDYVLDRFVIISESRSQRPHDFRVSFEQVEPEHLETVDKSCAFCTGNESMTTVEKGRVGDPWRIRWFDNKFAALAPIGKFQLTTDNKYFTFSDAYGFHEVIVETNDHSKQLSDLFETDIVDVLKVYRHRIQELSTKEHIRYVMIFKNHGKLAGTSLKHSHTQVTALSIIPRFIQETIDAVKKYPVCPYCEIINVERWSYRRCFENSSFVAFTPYASRFNYEIWIFPKKHYTSITQVESYELFELAKIIKQILTRLKIIDASYDLFIHNYPEYGSSDHDPGMHFHIEITPRISFFGGFEIGSEVIINSISPEEAAKFYRGD